MVVPLAGAIAQSTSYRAAHLVTYLATYLASYPSYPLPHGLCGIAAVREVSNPSPADQRWTLSDSALCSCRPRPSSRPQRMSTCTNEIARPLGTAREYTGLREHFISTIYSSSLLPPLAARFSYSLSPESALPVLFRRVLGQRLWLKSGVFPLSVSLVRK